MAKTKASTKKVAVVGFGNIGTGVVELLYQKGSVDYRYVIVDEYQDVNPLQDSLLQLLCDTNGNLAAVGDRIT